MRNLKLLASGILMIMAVSCGGNEDPAKVGSKTQPVEVSQALGAARGSEVTVAGFLIVEMDGNSRLCTLLLESFPPQCGGDRITLTGLDLSTVPGTKRINEPSEISTVTWTETQIVVTGVKGPAGLDSVRTAEG